MSSEGYGKIAEENPSIWCTHYFLADTSQKQAIMQVLENSYGGDIHVHENAWSGLYGIISAMQALIVFMYGIVSVFILVVVSLVAAVLKLCGISNFSSRPSIVSILLPAIVVVGMFIGFAYLTSGRIKKVSLVTLIAE